MHGVRRKGGNGGARKYHELVGRSNSTTTAMALAAVTAIVFIVPPSQIESRIGTGTKYLKKVYDIVQHLGDTPSSIGRGQVCRTQIWAASDWK